MNLRTIAEAIDAYKRGASQADAARLDFFEGLYKYQQARADELVVEMKTATLSADEAEEAYFGDEPMLVKAPADIKSEEFWETCAQIAQYFAKEAGLDDDVSAALEDFDWEAFVKKLDLEQAGTNPPQFVEDCFQNFDTLGVDSSLPSSIVMMVVTCALRAHIQSVAARLFGSVSKQALKGSRLKPVNCPVCGSPAALSHVAMATGIDGREREQYCNVCGTVWPFDRMRCGVCGVDNPARLHYFHAEGDESHRLQNCDECGRYQRVFFEESLEIPVSPEVEDVVMAKLDAIALDPRFRVE